MITFLDLLVLVALVLGAVSVLSVALMFLVKNRKVKQVCLYLAAALSVYMGYVGIRILWPMYTGLLVISVMAALGGIAAVVLERLSKGSEKRFLLAQILAAVSLVTGLLSAFVL